MSPLSDFPLPRVLASLTVWLLVLAVIFVPLERRFAECRSHGLRRQGIVADIGYFFLSGLIPAMVLSPPMLFLAWLSHRLLPDAMTAAIAAWPVWLRVAASLVAAEIGLYWGHRWSHEVPVLWRFHVVHHGPTEVDWLVNTHGHPIDFIFTRFCGLLPLYALGLASPLAGHAAAIPLLVMVPGVLWGFFIHANLRWRFGPLEWLVATPAFHRWHHTNDGPACIDKNYAPMWPWIDRLFGTYYLPRDHQPLRYGTDTPVASGMAGQLLDPFVVPVVPPGALTTRPAGR
jgi:sterol desaturase/sphingolipid hydroxylase (fatty acid hydroxylase superfamily)